MFNARGWPCLVYIPSVLVEELPLREGLSWGGVNHTVKQLHKAQFCALRAIQNLVSLT